MEVALAAKGSISIVRGEAWGAEAAGKLFLRARGFGFCREARTFTGGAEAGSFVGVFGLKAEEGEWEVGGGGACRDGTKGSR
jgi:hypothetical protein